MNRLVVTVVLVLAANAAGQEPSHRTNNSSGRTNAPVTKSNELDCSVVGKSAMLAAEKLWQERDGEASFWASDNLLLILATCPNEFYAYVSSRPAFLRQWLSEVEGLSGLAVDETDATRREQFLSELVADLRVRHTDLKDDQLRNDIVKVLQSLCIRVVDAPEAKRPCPRGAGAAHSPQGSF